jgi:Plasmid pRiA4b ORF-3-like protein
MAQNVTLTIRVALESRRSVYRDVEIEATNSLYQFAEAIVSAFGFDFDHAFGFYSGLTYRTTMRALPKYELFADMGEAEPGVLGVKKVKVVQAFPAVGHKMVFLFDYGDDWRFRTTVMQIGAKIARVRYPRVVAARGEAPKQYPAPEEDDEEEDGPIFGVNLVTGEKIWVKKSSK